MRMLNRTACRDDAGAPDRRRRDHGGSRRAQLLDRIAEREPVVRAWGPHRREAGCCSGACDTGGRGRLKACVRHQRHLRYCRHADRVRFGRLYRLSPNFSASAVSLRGLPAAYCSAKTVTTEFGQSPSWADRQPAQSGAHARWLVEWLAAAVADFMCHWRSARSRRAPVIPRPRIVASSGSVSFGLFRGRDARQHRELDTVGIMARSSPDIALFAPP